jgi:CxxC-x17-CxxC domain-containing protein
MSFYDKTLTCRDCGERFVWTSEDQEFFASKGFNQPSRCQDCRSARKSDNGKQRHEEHFVRTASCIECGTEVKVTKSMENVKAIRCRPCYEAFKARPVYEVSCRECGRTKRRSEPHPNPDKYICSDCFKKRESELYTVTCDGPGCGKEMKLKRAPDPGRPFYCRECKQTGNKVTYPAVCNNCLEEFEVPFEPDPSRPIYCQSCKDERDARRLTRQWGGEPAPNSSRRERSTYSTRGDVWNYNAGGGRYNKGGRGY